MMGRILIIKQETLQL